MLPRWCPVYRWHELVAGAGMDRRTCRSDSDGQVKWVQAARWSQEGGPASGEHRERQSTDAGHRGGPARSSDEGLVMGPEPGGRAVQGRPTANPSGQEPGEGPKRKVKSFGIRKRLVFEAWQRVQANGGAPGVDAVSIERFAGKEASNLYKLWNRMSSGSYFPGPVRAVEIPKDQGQGVRVLGVPGRRHSAVEPSDRLGFVVVTYPFHPLSGQRLEVLFAKRRDDGVVFVCGGGAYGSITLPQAWTGPG